MTMVGADVAQLRQLANRLIQTAGQLRGIRFQVAIQLSTTQWRGRDAQQFRAQWHNESSRQLNTVIGALESLATVVKAEADQQEQASAQIGGALSGLPGLLNRFAGLAESLGQLPLVGGIAGAFAGGLVGLGQRIGEMLGIGLSPEQRPSEADSSPLPQQPTDPQPVQPGGNTPARPVAAGGDYGARTADFVNQWNGKGVDADGHYGAQCFDIFRKYSNDVVGAHGGIATGSDLAADIYRRYDVNGVNQFYDRIPVGSGSPQPGDVVVFDARGSYSGYGHVGIVSSVAPDGTIGVFEQNYDGKNRPGFTSSPAMVRNHPGNESEILGYLRPKK